MTFSAVNLPPGLSINSSTGAISGTIADNADVNSPYDVTVTASDYTPTPSANASQTFTWKVYDPQVVIDLNDSTDPSYALAQVGGDSIPVLITLENASPGTHTVDINIPSGLADLDTSSFDLADGETATANYTAVNVSEEAQDVVLAAQVDGINKTPTGNYYSAQAGGVTAGKGEVAKSPFGITWEIS